MPLVKTLPKQNTEISKEVWELMVKDFNWSLDELKNLRVGVRLGKNLGSRTVFKFQIFEVVIAALFAKLRPDYDWEVTPNSPDGGIDFIGRGIFLTSTELGINAAITIGGQCKKEERGRDVLAKLSGSFTRMETAIHPTFFVAAFSSSSLTAKNIANTKRMLEEVFRRPCHILDRNQLEGLIADNLDIAKPVIRQGLSGEKADSVLNYFEKRATFKTVPVIQVSVPSLVLAGEPFRIRLKIGCNPVPGTVFRLTWSPSASQQTAGILVSPLGAESKDGIELNFQVISNDDPFVIEQELEFLLYAIGSQPLGTISVWAMHDTTEPSTVMDLPSVNVVENLRPPFYEVPYREPLDEIERGLARARAGRVSCVAIVGAGGAGKTRLCEEIALESRRRGAYVVSAHQAHSTEFPRRILVNLLLGLTDTDFPNQSITNRISNILSRLEPDLAKRAQPAIEALCGEAGKPGSFEDDQSLLSVLAVLIAQRSRSQTVIIHLHDLHWCTLDVLDTIDRLIWQLDHLKIQDTSGTLASGIRVLFLLEGRMHEYRQDFETGWSTRMFERFIERLGCPVARCRAFEPGESAVFAQRLFEQTHSAKRMLPQSLLELQQELIDNVYHVAGGNPFHMLEQVKLYQQRGILVQNPNTGFLYMVNPDFRNIALPRTVFETIEARWRYYLLNNRKLAVLLWALSLVDDNLPVSLFNYLWSRIAPDVTQSAIESTEFLRLSQLDEEGLQVSFRHENYFQTMRRVQVSESERQVVTEAYSEWFKKTKRLSPGLRYVQAKVALEAPAPDLKQVRKILKSAQSIALKRQDRSLLSRILVTLLDGVTWTLNQQKPLSSSHFMNACEDEMILCQNLTLSGRTDIARERIQNILNILNFRLHTRSKASNFIDFIMQRRFLLLIMKARILYHDRQPAEAVKLTRDMVMELTDLEEGTTGSERLKWKNVIMEVRHAHSVAVALSGNLKQAVIEARKAVDIAETLLNTSPTALDVIITYANILLCESPEESEAILQHYQNFAKSSSVREETRLRLNLNISMARILLGYSELRRTKPHMSHYLFEARETLLDVFRKSHPLGRLSTAAATALLLGLICSLQDESKAVDWFAQAVALSSRASQLETLWRAQINLAHSLYQSGYSAHDPAAAAFDILKHSLTSYAEPDRTPRFDLVAVPMAHAVRYLILAGDERAEEALRKFPALRRMFKGNDLKLGSLKEDRDGRTSHEWLRIGSLDYVIY